jgi:hypothetical protein
MLNPHIQKRINKLRAEVAMMQNVPSLRNPQRLLEIEQEFVLLTGLTIASMIEKQPSTLAQSLDAEVNAGGFYIIAKRDANKTDPGYIVEGRIVEMNESEVLDVIAPMLKMTKERAMRAFKGEKRPQLSTRTLVTAMCVINIITLLVVANALIH